MVGWAAARPGRVLAAVLVLAVLGGGLALWRLAPSASTSALVGSGSAAGRATATVQSRFGDDAVYVLVRGDLARLVLTADLNKLLGLEGCLSGNVPAGAAAPGGAGSPCAALARSKPVRVVYGPGTFINSSVSEITEQLQAQTRARAAQADRAREAARRVARVAGPLGGRGAAAGAPGGAARLRAVRARVAGAQRQVRPQPDRRAEGQRPGFRLPARVRPRARGAGAEGALRLPVPVGGLRARVGAAEGRAVGHRAGAGGGARARGGGDGRVAPGRRRALRGHRRAGAGRRSHRRAGRFDAAAAAGRRGGDGARARAAVPLAAAAAAARARAVRRRDRLRRAGRARAAVDDGVDRRAAGAAGAGGRLRGPVPGAGGVGGVAGDGGAGDLRRLPRAAALPGADGARVRGAAGGRRGGGARDRVDRGHGGADAGPPRA